MFHKRGTDYKKVPMGRPFAIRALRSEVEYVPQFSRIGYLDRTMKPAISDPLRPKKSRIRSQLCRARGELGRSVEPQRALGWGIAPLQHQPKVPVLDCLRQSSFSQSSRLDKFRLHFSAEADGLVTRWYRHIIPGNQCPRCHWSCESQSVCKSDRETT